VGEEEWLVVVVDAAAKDWVMERREILAELDFKIFAIFVFELLQLQLQQTRFVLFTYTCSSIFLGIIGTHSLRHSLTHSNNNGFTARFDVLSFLTRFTYEIERAVRNGVLFLLGSVRPMR